MAAQIRMFCVTKNTGPSWNSDPLHLVYIGTDSTAASESVGDFRRYEKAPSEFPREFEESYSILPRDIRREMIQYYMADGWWYSVVMFYVEAAEGSIVDG